LGETTTKRRKTIKGREKSERINRNGLKTSQPQKGNQKSHKKMGGKKSREKIEGGGKNSCLTMSRTVQMSGETRNQVTTKGEGERKNWGAERHYTTYKETYFKTHKKRNYKRNTGAR